MKIAIVSTSMGVAWGGAEELWAATARSALAAGHRVLASVHKHDPEAAQLGALRAGGVEVFRRPGPTMGRIDAALARLPLRFGHVARFAPDVILVSQASAHEISHVGILRELDEMLGRAGAPYVPLVQWAAGHYPLPDSTRARSRGYYERAARTLFVAARNREDVERQLGAHLERAEVVRNPVNMSSTEGLAWPDGGQSGGGESGTMRLASVGRLDIHAKGQDVMLAALGETRWRERDWTLDIYGVGEDEPYLRRLAAMYGVESRVNFRGQTKDIRGVWAEHHALLLPSQSEGTPLVLVEAMLCGRASVVTDVGGNTEWVTDGREGMVAAAATPGQFGAAMERFWTAREHWPEMGRAARERALKQYDPEPGRTVLSILQRVAERRG